VEFPALKVLLSPDELRRAGRLLDAQKAQALIVGRGRLRQILGAYLQCEPTALDFVYGVDGKPALSKPRDTMQFNLSHSGDWAVLAISAGVAIGVDLEKIDPALDFAVLATRFFTAAENADLLAAAPQRQRRRFYRLWTRKEALLKGQGQGFTASAVMEEGQWSLRSFWLAPGYVAAIACAGEMQELRRWQAG
jgi:4'-phosphopantetheinyl transferase